MATEVMALPTNSKVWPSANIDDDEDRSANSQYGRFQVTLRLDPAKSLLPLPTPSPSVARRPRIVDVKSTTPEKGDVLDGWKPRLPPQADVCVECAMRDADMADVDVTSPGVWDRESDVEFEELLRREREDEREGRTPPPAGPRSKGLSLTESNLRLWLSMNPKEAHARDHTVKTYVKAQRTLLEAEHIARSEAVRESQELTEQMRHTYSSLRRSAYELSSSYPSEEGVRICQLSPINGITVPDVQESPSSKKETVLLENGMIMEKLDLKKEEQARRKRAARSRQRADSRTSARELLPSAASVRSMGSCTRPISVATSPMPARHSQVLPSAHSRLSQSSLEASTSLDRGSKSPRFFTFRNWSDAASRSSVALSGSMMDMHLGLDYDQQGDIPPLPPLPATITSPIRNTPSYPPEDAMPLKKVPSRGSTVVSKRKSKFGRLFRLLSGSKGDEVEKPIGGVATDDPNVDDPSLPLDPPPPLSLLVERTRSPSLTYSHTRHAQSTLSLSSTSARNPNFSSFTSASSALTTPTSPKFRDMILGERDIEQAPHRLSSDLRHLHRIASESDIKHTSSTTVQPRQSRTFPQSAPHPDDNNSPRPTSSYLDKALPPIPPGAHGRYHTITPQMRSMPPQVPFSQSNGQLEPSLYMDDSFPRYLSEQRRQSFGGLATRPSQYIQSCLNTADTQRRYSEFGLSRRSLNKYDDDAMHYYEKPSQILASKMPDGGNAFHTRPTPSKRRSRFGLSSLFRRKSHAKESSAPQMAFMPYSSLASLTPERTDYRSNSACRSTGALVDQDQHFVAYRYPSMHEQLGLST